VGPRLLNAFSPDGEGLALHFSEPVDPASAGVAANYMVTGNDASQIGVVGARVDGDWVHLTLDPGAHINNEVTYTCRASNLQDVCGNALDNAARESRLSRSVYLAIIWHQHQPSYIDPANDKLLGPWVRKHVTKDYYDMASVLERFPDVHMSINLTPVLLMQLDMYLERLGPYVDVAANTIDVERFLAEQQGHTDAWIDMLLTPTPDGSASLTQIERDLFYKGAWCTVSTSSQIMHYFPEYEELRDANRALYSQEQLRALKVFFELAWFDPDFLNGRVDFPEDPDHPVGNFIDLSDVVRKDEEGRFWLREPASEELAQRMVVENYKATKAVLPIHRRLRYSPSTKQGQIEILTTPFYHPILPLIYDTDLAAQQMDMENGYDRLPTQRFSYPEDAHAQVAKAVNYYERLFGEPPRGMWPGEGSVAEEVVAAFVDNGVDFIATGQDVLRAAKPNGAAYYPYRIDVDRVEGDGGSSDDEMLILFRDNELSDRIGFHYQSMSGEDAARDFIGSVLSQAPRFGARDRMVVVILDGENAWESYREHDGKRFFDALYRELQRSQEMGEIITVTPSEYIDGNPARAVPAHPIHDQEEIEGLPAGSWIFGNFATWIGEPEENLCWDALTDARAMLEASGVPRPNPMADPPSIDADPLVLAAWQAWEEMYAAEGSDGFWWFGGDQNTPGNDDTPFDLAFRFHVVGMYESMNLARALMGMGEMAWSEPPPCVQKPPELLRGPFEDPPAIDGRYSPNETEWTAVGGLFNDDDSGAIFNPNDIIRRVHFGYDDDALYVAVQTKLDDLPAHAGNNMQIGVYTSQKHITDRETGRFEEDPANSVSFDGANIEFSGAGAARSAVVDFAGAEPRLVFSEADGRGGWSPIGGHTVELGGPVRGNNLLEFRLPYGDLGTAGQDDPMEFVVVAHAGGEAVDAAPNLGTQIVFEDPTKLVYVTFEVDVSGDRFALDRFSEIAHQPQPRGRGIVYIVGNHPTLGNWVPNTVSLRNDGEGGDREADDGFWTGTFPIARGNQIEYKYLIATPTDEESWRGEEYPISYRGFDVSQDPDCRRMLLRDVFTDRPRQDGQTSDLTEITCPQD